MSQKIKSSRKYNTIIVLLSIIIPIVVASLFRVKIDMDLPVFLPPIYATINGLTAILLVIAIWAIKKGNRVLHERLIKVAIGCSIAFLVMYVLYHMTSDSTEYGGTGTLRPIYFFILISHIVLSVIVIPFVLITYVRAITNDFERHKKIAKLTFPLWLYVAVTGVLVYLMISPYY